MIELESFSIGHGKNILLEDVTTRFDNGSLTAMIGRNGTGKSTLIRAITGLNRRYGGSIRIDGDNTLSLTPLEMARRMALVTTERVRIANLKCRDVVATGRAPYTNRLGKLSPEDKNIIFNVLHRVGMDNFADRPIGSLSDGEAQRIMVARALAQQTPTLILDEPTSFLDIPSRRQLVQLLRSLAIDEGMCILFSTHELDLAIEFATDIALISGHTLTNLPVNQMISTGMISEIFS